MMNSSMNMMSRNMEMISRLRKAAHYQKKAVAALLPECAESHIDVIGNELKLMLVEMLTASMVSNDMKNVESGENISRTEKEAKKKKVDIS